MFDLKLLLVEAGNQVCLVEEQLKEPKPKAQANDMITFRSLSLFNFFFLGAVHILRNTEWGGGLPDLLQYYIGVGLESLLQYYSFVRKMEGYNPFSALY